MHAEACFFLSNNSIRLKTLREQGFCKSMSGENNSKMSSFRHHVIHFKNELLGCAVEPLFALYMYYQEPHL